MKSKPIQADLVSLMGNDPTEQRPEHRFGSERVKKMLETPPKYYQRRSESRLLSSAVLSDAVGGVLVLG